MCESEVTLRPATMADASLLQGWLDGPGGSWLDYTFGAAAMLEYYLRNEELAHVYVVVIAGVDAGIITVNTEDLYTRNLIEIEHFLIAVSLRGRGYGSRALKCLLEMTDWSQGVPIRTQINPKNIISIKCFRRAGFSEVSSDEQSDDTVYMEYRRPTHSLLCAV